MRVVLNGRGGKVGPVLTPALEAAGHELVELDGAEAMVDFTAPDVVADNVAAALQRGVPWRMGRTGSGDRRVDAMARVRKVACFYAPNFAVGGVLMRRFAKEGA